MPAKKSKKHWVWLDMEMTGLDPEKEGILEIATIITDSNLKIIAEGPDLVIHQPAKKLAGMDAWNQKQHGKSGLIAAVKKSKIVVREAERRTLAFIKKYCFPKTAPLCGNSVHHDKRFLIRYMPRLAAYLHYRIVDVSTVKTLVQHWYPGKIKLPPKESSHRALQDIRESVAEMRFYRKHYFES